MARKEYIHEGFDSNVDLSLQSPPSVQKDEDAIWERFTRGDDQSLVYIYRTYAESLFVYGCQFSARKEFVRDCIQELFFELINKRRGLSAATSIKGYLFASLKRRIVRGMRREERLIFNENGFDLTFMLSTHAMAPAFDREDAKVIESKLNRLPVAQKEVILLHFYEGLGYQEIAEIMNIKVKSARALTYRALESLSKELSAFKASFYTAILALLLGA